MKRKAAVEVYGYDSGGGASLFADTIFEDEKPVYSLLLGPDGNNLMYSYPKAGFDLRKKDE